MKLLSRLTGDLSSRRAQHLVYLLHVWLCVPFLFAWVTDKRAADLLGDPVVYNLKILVVAMVAYMVIRTVVANKDPESLKWWLVFPPIDVAWITLLLCTTHRGPMSNITLLYFLPMIQASAGLSVRWSAGVGTLVVVGTTLATLTADAVPVVIAPTTIRELLHDDPLNVAFRVFFLLILSSLMAYQSLIAAGLKERLGVAADRARIAMEMHDGVQGHLIAIASQLELISRLAPVDGQSAAEIASEGREGARMAADELRFLVQRLRAPSLSQGFVPALRQYAHNLCERSGFKLEFTVSGEDSAVGPEVENAVFRIAQEAITNAVKHSDASLVTVSVQFLPHEVVLTVRDDGKGFDKLALPSGLGLDGMEMRAKDAGGSLAIHSEDQKGTSVEARFKIEATYV